MNPQSVVVNAAVAAVGRVVNALLGVVVTAITYRLLGVSSYGTYVLILSLGAILQMLADSGLYLSLARLIAAEPARQQDHISHILWLRWILFALVFGISLAVVGIVPQWRVLWRLLLVASGGLWFQSFSQLLMGVYQARAMVWRATVGDFMGRLAQLGIIALILRDSLTVGGALAAFTISSAVAWGVHRWLLPVRAIITRPSRASWRVWQNLLRDSWPLGLMLVLNAIYFRIDTVLLSWLRSPAEVGMYGIAYGIVEKVLFFPAMFGGLILPRLATALAHRQLVQAAAWITESLQMMMLAAIALLVIGIPLAPATMALITGQLSPSGHLLQILLIALVMMFLGNIFGFALVANRRQHALLQLYLGLVIFNVIANVLCIPVWGAEAAAWITVATETVSMGVAGIMLYQQIPFRLPLTFLRQLIVAALLTLIILVVMPASWPVVVRACIAGSAYLLATWAFGLLDRRHYALLYAAL